MRRNGNIAFGIDHSDGKMMAGRNILKNDKDFIQDFLQVAQLTDFFCNQRIDFKFPRTVEMQIILVFFRIFLGHIH